MSARRHQLISLFAVTTACAVLASPAVAQNRRSSLFYSWHVGSANPLGTLDSLTDANIHFAIDFGYELGRRMDDASYWNLKLIVGFNQFTAEIPTAIPHPHWTNISANVPLVTAPRPSGLRMYLQAGPGYYIPKSGSSDPGFNVGLGGLIPVGAPFNAQLGVDIHQIQTKPVTRFYTVQLGVLFR